MVSSTLKKMYFWVFLTYRTLFVRIMGATLEGLKVLACATAQHTQSLSHWQMTKKHSLFFFGSQNTPCHSFLYTLFVSYNKSLKSFYDFTISDSFKSNELCLYQQLILPCEFCKKSFTMNDFFQNPNFSFNKKLNW